MRNFIRVIYSWISSNLISCLALAVSIAAFLSSQTQFEYSESRLKFDEQILMSLDESDSMLCQSGKNIVCQQAIARSKSRLTEFEDTFATERPLLSPSVYESIVVTIARIKSRHALADLELQVSEMKPIEQSAAQIKP
jgi:hypothetical protein